jgi:nucleoside-diphosphate-sugar epimerase
MKVLVAGATGATGRLLVEQLLNDGHDVKVIVRSVDNLPKVPRLKDHLTIITASILDLNEAELAGHVKGCDAVASCLGHNITLKGIFGQPHLLVTQAVRNLCEAIRKNQSEMHTKFVLMNTTGNRNRGINEKFSLGGRFVIALIRLLVPPMKDNELSADYLRTQSALEWTAVRPDTLIDQDQVSEYDVYPSPTRNPIFDPGKTSRINVAHFMSSLIVNEELWNKWKGQMPVIYNREIKG